MPAFDNPTGKSIVRQGQTWYCGRTHGSKFWCLHSQGRIKRIAKGKCLGTLGWQWRWGSAVGELDYALDAERRWQSLAVSWSSHLRQEPKCLRRQWPRRERLYSDLLSDMFTPGHKETQRYEWDSSRLQRKSLWSDHGVFAINGLKFLFSEEKRQQCPKAAKPIFQSANSVVTPSKLDCYEYTANILCLTLHAVTILLTIPVYIQGTFLILQV